MTCRGSWTGQTRPCPRAYPLRQRDQSEGPSLPARYVAHRSAVLRPPRTPAALRTISPSAYTPGLCPTQARQTGLSCSGPDHAHVPPSVPREDPPGQNRNVTRRTWPSPRHDRLGSSTVSLTRLQGSLHATARVLAPSKEAFDTPLSPPPLSDEPGPATGRSGAYPDRTFTRRPGPACRTQHEGNLSHGSFRGSSTRGSGKGGRSTVPVGGQPAGISGPSRQAAPVIVCPLRHGCTPAGTQTNPARRRRRRQARPVWPWPW